MKKTGNVMNEYVLYMFCICFVYALYMLRICYLYALYMVKIWWGYGGDMWVIRAADNGRQREVRIREWLTVYGLLIKLAGRNQRSGRIING